MSYDYDAFPRWFRAYRQIEDTMDADDTNRLLRQFKEVYGAALVMALVVFEGAEPTWAAAFVTIITGIAIGPAISAFVEALRTNQRSEADEP